MAEVLCIPQTIPEHTGYRIRSIRVCAYCRVSTDDDGQYHSYDTQMEYYRGLIQKNPAWEFCGIYADEGISGTSRWGREDFRRMLEECEKGRIDLILTKSITRFARNTVDTLSTVRHLKEIGVSVYFEKEYIQNRLYLAQPLNIACFLLDMYYILCFLHPYIKVLCRLSLVCRLKPLNNI